MVLIAKKCISLGNTCLFFARASTAFFCSRTGWFGSCLTNANHIQRCHCSCFSILAFTLSEEAPDAIDSPASQSNNHCGRNIKYCSNVSAMSRARSSLFSSVVLESWECQYISSFASKPCSMNAGDANSSSIRHCMTSRL